LEWETSDRFRKEMEVDGIVAGFEALKTQPGGGEGSGQPTKS